MTSVESLKCKSSMSFSRWKLATAYGWFTVNIRLEVDGHNYLYKWVSLRFPPLDVVSIVKVIPSMDHLACMGTLL